MTRTELFELACSHGWAPGAKVSDELRAALAAGLPATLPRYMTKEQALEGLIEELESTK